MSSVNHSMSPLVRRENGRRLVGVVDCVPESPIPVGRVQNICRAQVALTGPSMMQLTGGSAIPLRTGAVASRLGSATLAHRVRQQRVERVAGGNHGAERLVDELPEQAAGSGGAPHDGGAGQVGEGSRVHEVQGGVDGGGVSSDSRPGDRHLVGVLSLALRAPAASRRSSGEAGVLGQTGARPRRAEGPAARRVGRHVVPGTTLPPPPAPRAHSSLRTRAPPRTHPQLHVSPSSERTCSPTWIARDTAASVCLRLSRIFRACRAVGATIRLKRRPNGNSPFGGTSNTLYKK